MYHTGIGLSFLITKEHFILCLNFTPAGLFNEIKLSGLFRLLMMIKTFLTKLPVINSIFCLVLNMQVHAQRSGVIFPEFHYEIGSPKSDLADRFGSHLGIGAGLNYQPFNSKLNIAARMTYYFGNEVKEDILKPYRSSFQGLLLGFDGLLTEMKLRERLSLIQISGGRLFPVFSQKSARQSIKLELGIAYYQHYIRFVDDARALPQFSTQVLQGLDRLSNGFAIVPSLGYEFISTRKWLSFYTGIETMIGFGANRRSFNYDTGISELGLQRSDIMINFKFALYLPFFLNRNDEEIEY